MQTIALAPEIAGRLANAELTEPATGHRQLFLSVRAHGGRGYLMVGDAWRRGPGFFSAASTGHEQRDAGAGRSDAVLKDPAQAPRLNREFERTVRARVLKTFPG